MSYDKQQATHEFTRWSESYDRSILQTLLFAPSQRAIIGRIRQRFGHKPITLLDVGCGTGVFASRVKTALPNARIFGIDLVAGMLNQGRERWQALAESVTPIQGDSERLPFATDGFDVLTCSNSFHHYPHQDHAVREMHRVLRPGGQFLLVDGYRDAPWGWFIYDVCVAGVEGDVHHASSSRVRELASAAGFGEIHQKVHRGFAPFLLTEATAKPDDVFTIRRSNASVHVPAPHFRPASQNPTAAKNARRD